MRNYWLILIILLFYSASSFAQARKPKSYALVIGISKYKDESINSLNFADRDARAFENFCISDQGLGIPKENIKTFVNEEASYFNIISGLNWLKEIAKKDDQVYFYFAGHGDMESEQLKYGYLLPYDSRSKNYLGMSLSLDILNKTANTLSADRKAKVFLITDACHSGKLAGVDFNGSNLVALNLMQLTSKNEVRITSCSEDQLSYEDQSWGGGRGAFSYFLTKGMAGEADGTGGKKDGTITIAEIKSYLNGKVPDNVKTVKSAKQDPVVMGNESTVLNSYKIAATNQDFIPSALQTNDLSLNTGARSVTAKSVNVLHQDITNSVSSKVREKDIDFKVLATKPPSEIVDVLLVSLIIKKKYTKNTLTSTDSKQIIAKTLFDKVQHIIDLYLSGDEAELEKRRYYSQVDKPYDQYPYMLETAIKLLPKEHLLIPSLEMQKEYITGLSFRLKVHLTKDYLNVIDTALIHQQKALALDSNAAYIQNETGILYVYKNNYELAEYHFNKAMIIAPKWSLPYANLANLYFLKREYKEAKTYVDLALNKQKNLQSPYILDGELYEKDNNYLYAEEQYQKAIKLNNRYYHPYQKLGELYLKTQDYIKSNEYFFEADKRKQGLIWEELFPLFKNIPRRRNLETCNFDSSRVSAGDVMAHFVVGKAYFDEQNYELAQKWFEKVVAYDASHPLVYHYLGQTAYYFKSYSKAEFYFKRSIDLYLSDTLFSKHVYETALKSDYDQQWKESCIYDSYTKANFELYDSKLYLGKTYEKWNNYTSAIDQYNECINLEPKFRVAFYMLWNLYKNKNDLLSAENTIQRFGKHHPDLLDWALAEFYAWALYTHKEDLEKSKYYTYKYGHLLHNYMMKSPDRDWGESLEITRDHIEQDFPNDFDSLIIVVSKEEKERLIEEAVFILPKEIQKPLSTGVAMFKRFISFSADKTINADAYEKTGDFYARAKSDFNALENYEKSVKLKDGDIGLRNKIMGFADNNHLFHKAFTQLIQLNDSDHLNYDGTILLAKYYMKAGDSIKSSYIYTKISETHPFLKEIVKKDIIKQSLRFNRYQKTIDLISHYLKSDSTDMMIEYMLARCFAGLNKPEESLKHILNAIDLGFDLAYVYINDTLFDKYRTLNDDWTKIEELMGSTILHFKEGND